MRAAIDTSCVLVISSTLFFFGRIYAISYPKISWRVFLGRLRVLKYGLVDYSNGNVHIYFPRDADCQNRVICLTCFRVAFLTFFLNLNLLVNRMLKLLVNVYIFTDKVYISSSLNDTSGTIITVIVSVVIIFARSNNCCCDSFRVIIIVIVAGIR